MAIGSVVGSEPKRDKNRGGGGVDSGTVPGPPQATETTISQAGQPNTSASAIVIAPSNAEVDVSTAVSPTGATLEEQCHEHHRKNPP
ncbi:hypothetical protein NL676_037763 [Syzygium grande]|nr:hypothetical protein NL676_037763 [Syzygium grande]